MWDTHGVMQKGFQLKNEKLSFDQLFYQHLKISVNYHWPGPVSKCAFERQLTASPAWL